MSSRTDILERLAPLWAEPAVPARWVIWHRPGGESLVFDREFNMPLDVDFDLDDVVLGEVLGRMRAAGIPETDVYPGRPCG
ncbi:hypothetical protein GCM10010331_45930 [Streptomyces xanthochromogenes]|uniref:hypothetical protein n=1 Tax=Streptomyces xanthochromogenes TaxID=67384 RepID=UPI00167656D3|nr:hypothetical protein [Streptomyces xanthochromogenes]GHB53070.1 hypothetical protein GCM10010331_45930 [Streptomyces xanthochromogenes]